MKLPFLWQNGQWLQISHLFFFKKIFIYLIVWLWLVFVDVLGLSLVAAKLGGYSLIAVCGFLIVVNFYWRKL